MSRNVSVVLSQSVLLLLLAFSSAAFAAEPTTDAAQQEVKSTVERIRSVVAAEKTTLTTEQLDLKLHDILLPIFDFEMMSKSSLGANWKKATPAQQQEFVTLFSKLLGRSYLARIRRNIEDSQIEFLPSMLTGERVVVRCKIISDGDVISADYRMHQKDGKWRIYDAIVENVGLVTNYRNEFASLLEGGKTFDDLLQRLRDQAEAGEKAPAGKS